MCLVAEVTCRVLLNRFLGMTMENESNFRLYASIESARTFQKFEGMVSIFLCCLFCCLRSGWTWRVFWIIYYLYPQQLNLGGFLKLLEILSYLKVTTLNLPIKKCTFGWKKVPQGRNCMKYWVTSSGLKRKVFVTYICYYLLIPTMSKLHMNPYMVESL